MEPMRLGEGGGGDGGNVVPRENRTSGVILVTVKDAFTDICSMISFGELKRLRQVCRAFKAVVDVHPRFLNCAAWLEHDWIEESRGMNFENCPKFTSYRFRFFPFKRNTLFNGFWNTCGTNVTKIYFSNVKMPCHWMVNFLQGCPHLVDVTFRICLFHMEVCGTKTLRNRREANARTSCCHTNGLEDLRIPEEELIAPKIHSLTFKYQDVMPLCILEYILARAEGTITNFIFMDATWPNWKRDLHYPTRRQMNDRFGPFLKRNEARIERFTYLRNHRGDLFLENLRTTHRLRIDPIELIIGQKSSWDNTATAEAFINFIRDCTGNRTERFYLRFIHRVPTRRVQDLIATKTNVKHVTLDFIWPDANEWRVHLHQLLPRWPQLEKLELWDRNRRGRPTMTFDYFNTLIPREGMKELQFFHFGQPIDEVQILIGSRLAKTLTRLEIESGKDFTNEMMQVIISDLQQLEVLSICNSMVLTDCGITGLNERAVKIITECKNPIINTHQINPTLLVGRNIKEMKNLRKLSFCMSRKVSDISIILGFKFPEIREINLSWCLNITDGGLYHLVKNNPSLERIVLMKNRKITHYGLNELVSTFPTLKNIHTSRSCRDRRLGKQLNYVEHPRFKRIVSFAKWNHKRPVDFGDA